MPTFIKQKEFTGLNTAGEPVTGFRHYSDDELLDFILAGERSRFFDVGESHANNVLRKQSVYQEITGHVLEAYRTFKPQRRKARGRATQGDRS